MQYDIIRFCCIIILLKILKVRKMKIIYQTSVILLKNSILRIATVS